ncbi:hypothetical protein Drose_30730 [Dactylosporangium roseum]|uniref:Prepilin-type N-terminal cleavage/methylation domain-containing protein n=1 Tax=Dactylosporangium roseum TaxID=47989 RepID=A0ABY5Z0C8_9ACTN|nr:hypothetical protein [Dactylosporangium roseum]UWZ35465.1 hypothetical protein Drose_30730 [Dactylosporangium roseum]
MSIPNILARLRRRAGAGADDDRGVTLAEMAVTTGILSAVMAIFTTGVVQLFRAGNNNQMVALTQAELNTAFLRLDRELRYAAGIGPVHPTGGGGGSVEYVNTETATGVPECAQLHLDAAGGTLRRQVWPQGTKPQHRWTVLASEVDVAKSSFTLPPLTENTGFQRLRIKLVVTTPGLGRTVATTDITFTALNSTRGTDPATVCPEART